MSGIERHPLLSPSLDVGNEDRATSSTSSVSRKEVTAWPRTLTLIFLLKFTKTFYHYLLELPFVRLVEQALCQEHYKLVGSAPNWREVNEAMCKLPVIQDRLAKIMGWRMTFNALPGLFTALFFGALADRYGRRPIFALGCVGESIALAWILSVGYSDTKIDIKMIWLESVFYLIGGGVRFLYAMLFTMVADIVPPEARSRTLFFLHALSHATRLPALYVSAVFMDTNLWLPFAIAVGSQVATFAIVLAMPETRSGSSMNAKPSRDDAFPPSAYLNTGDTDSSSVSRMIRSIWLKYRKMLLHPGLVIVFSYFVLKRIAFSSASETFIYQYTSERFSMRLSQIYPVRVSYILGAILINLVILPIVTWIWRPQTTHIARRDLNIARACLTSGTIGFVIIWEAHRYFVVCIGTFFVGLTEGLEPSLQAIGSYIAGDALNASLFSFITMMDTIAELIAGPIMSGLLTFRDSAGVSLGLCFLASAVSNSLRALKKLLTIIGLCFSAYYWDRRVFGPPL